MTNYDRFAGTYTLGWDGIDNANERRLRDRITYLEAENKRLNEHSRTLVYANDDLRKQIKRLTANGLHSIKNIIFNDPATIVFWSDGTKTVVKCDEREAYDPEKGLAMAFSKKFFGNEGNYYEQFKKWLPEEEEEVIRHTLMEGSLQEALDDINDRIRAAFNIPEGDRRCSVCKHEAKLTVEDPCRECCQISRHPFFEKKEEK